MPAMTEKITTTATSINRGIFSGETHEYVQRPSWVDIYACVTVLDIAKLTVNIGGKVHLDDQNVIPVNAVNAIIVKPDHHICRCPALPGDRIMVDVRGTGAGDCRVLVDIQEVG